MTTRGDRVKFTPDQANADLAELTDIDVRYVAVVWRNDGDGNGRPELVLGGISEYEAESVLRSAVGKLAAYNLTTIDVPADIDLELEDDDAEDA